MQHLIVTYGYLAIFLLMLAESACVPVPSEVTMLFGGALASGAIAGTRLNIVAVVLAGTAGNVAGSYLAWAVGRWAGPAAVHRWGRLLRLTDHDIDRAQQWFVRHGAASVFFGRLLPVIRTFISLPAGFAGDATHSVRGVHRGRVPAMDCCLGMDRIRHRRELASRRERLSRTDLCHRCSAYSSPSWSEFGFFGVDANDPDIGPDVGIDPVRRGLPVRGAAECGRATGAHLGRTRI